MRNVVFFLLLFFATSALSAQKPVEAVRYQKILKPDFGAVLHTPEGMAGVRYPGILTLGGSEGGLGFSRTEADSIARLGFVVLRVAYFNLDSTKLPRTLEEIPLEYMLGALDYLKSQPAVDPGRIGVLCVSKGTEAGLWLATQRPEVKAVAAHVPSHVYWYGLTKRMSSKKSSWTYKGTPLPFVPVAKPEEGWFTDVVANYYRAGLREHPEAEKTAAIPVERMQCALLLTSGGRDNVWPSARMATALVQRLRGASYAYHVEHLEFPDAGHAVFNYPPTLPAEFEVEKNGEASLFGRTPQANHDAQTATWKATLAFFQNHLKQ